ncbi:MAG: FAD-binding oxidoreductase [Granulosicoccaceae bacterium]
MGVLTQKLKQELIQALSDIVGERNLLQGEALNQRSRHFNDARPPEALALVMPTTTEQVSKVLAACNSENQSLVTHGGLTGLVGGEQSTTDDVVLSLERMTKIENIDLQSSTMTVQAGCILETVQKAAADADKYFPLDLGARGSCTIGGNIATNAGGLSVLRYGMMRNQVLGLEAVLADGTVMSSLNQMLKNNAGYDLKQLFIGSEGTLGVVTRAVLRLQPAPSSVQTALLAFDQFSQITATLDTLSSKLNGQLSAFEIIWNNFYRLSTANNSKSSPPLDNHYPFYAVVESRGADVQQDEVVFNQAIEQLAEAGAITDATIAQSSQQSRQIWEIRENVECTKHYGARFRYDISLPVASMDHYIAELEAALVKQLPNLIFCVYGHIADGNLHLQIAPQEQAITNDAMQAAQLHDHVNQLVYQPLQALGGSISAEHGIGKIKKAYLHLCKSDVEISIMKQLKRSLDPKNMLNPGKIFD